MTRTSITVDRVIALVVGVALVAVGVGALIWPTGLIAGLPETITAPSIAPTTDTWWWRWAVAAAGLVCVAVALRWLAAHKPARKAASIQLHDSGDVGTITIDPAAVAAVAAEALRRHPAVRTVKSKAVTERNSRTIEMAVTAAHPDEFVAVISAIDENSAQIARSLGDAPLAVRSTLHIKGGRELTQKRLR